MPKEGSTFSKCELSALVVLKHEGIPRLMFLALYFTALLTP